MPGTTLEIESESVSSDNLRNNAHLESKAKAQRASESNSQRRWLILVGLVVSAILEVMDTSMLNVALPQMAGNLGATTTDIAWVSTGYILANVIVLPMTAWLSQRFGRKNYLLVSIAVFSISRLFCAFSHSLGVIVLWRIIQGAAGAALISTSQAVLVDIFPAAQQAMVQSIFAIGLVVAPAIAPAAGGWIVDNYSWQVLFYIHIPVAMVSLFLIGTMFHETSTPQERAATGKVDSLGIALLAIGFGSLQYVLEEGERYDWFSNIWIAYLAVIAIVSIVWLIAWQLSPRNNAPVLDLRVYKDRGLSAGVALSFALGFGLYCINFAYPVFVQSFLGFTSVKAGLAILPQGTALFISLMITAGLIAKFDPRLLIAIGFLISGIGSWLLGFNTLQTDISDTWFGLALTGFGMGMVFIPITLAAFAGLKGSQIGTGSAQLGLGRQLGGSFGIAIINTFITGQIASHRGDLVQHTALSNTGFTGRIGDIAAGLMHQGYDVVAAQRAALTLLDQTINIQSGAMAFNDGFQLIALIFVIVIPLVLLLKKPEAGAAPPPPSH